MKVLYHTKNQSWFFLFFTFYGYYMNVRYEITRNPSPALRIYYKNEIQKRFWFPWISLKPLIWLKTCILIRVKNYWCRSQPRVKWVRNLVIILQMLLPSSDQCRSETETAFLRHQMIKSGKKHNQYIIDIVHCSRYLWQRIWKGGDEFNLHFRLFCLKSTLKTYFWVNIFM